MSVIVARRKVYTSPPRATDDVPWFVFAIVVVISFFVIIASVIEDDETSRDCTPRADDRGHIVVPCHDPYEEIPYFVPSDGPKRRAGR